ncbi:MAG: c-type cytochrome [Elusimicrobia bacterium]|nr:c-type cytochrome [Elusimicrobiota bacterium]
MREIGILLNNLKKSLLQKSVLSKILPIVLTLPLYHFTTLPLLCQDLPGKAIFEQKCAQCHGVNGTPFQQDPNNPSEYLKHPDGTLKTDEKAAPAASLVFPRPRDFTRGAFKVRATPNGEIPFDGDLVHIIAVGMPGSSMPSWKEALTEHQIRDVVAYIKTFSDRFQSEKPSSPLVIGKPLKATESSLKKGREIFMELQCFQCHGMEGRADGPSAAGLNDDWGNPIPPANFHKGWNFRGGHHVENIYRTIMTGFNGTPMPSYADAFGDDKDKPWHLANYIHSLSADQPNTQEVLSARYTSDKLPDSPDGALWNKLDPVDFPLSGQIIQEPRHFTPSIDMISVRAAYNNEEVALLLEWDDPTRDVTAPADSVQIQIPMILKESEKPYFMEGDPRNPANLWRWDAKTDRLSNLRSTGMKSSKRALESQSLFSSSSTFSDGQWRLLVKRKRASEPLQGLSLEGSQFVPIAFSAWDGGKKEQDFRRSLSTWYYIFLEPPASKAPYAYALFAFFLVAGLERRLLKKSSKLEVPCLAGRRGSSKSKG